MKPEKVYIIPFKSDEQAFEFVNPCPCPFGTEAVFKSADRAISTLKLYRLGRGGFRTRPYDFPEPMQTVSGSLSTLKKIVRQFQS